MIKSAATAKAGEALADAKARRRRLNNVRAVCSIIALCSVVAICHNRDSDSSTDAAIPEPVAPAQPTAAGLQTPIVKLSADGRQLAALYADLQRSRVDTDLSPGHRKCCDYGDWERRAKRLQARAGMKLFKETGLFPNELVQLSEDYRQNEGESTEYQRQIEGKAALAFSPPARGKARGIIVKVTTSCQSFDVIDARGRRSTPRISRPRMSCFSPTAAASCNLLRSSDLIGEQISQRRGRGGRDAGLQICPH